MYKQYCNTSNYNYFKLIINKSKLYISLYYTEMDKIRLGSKEWQVMIFVIWIK